MRAGASGSWPWAAKELQCGGGRVWYAAQTPLLNNMVLLSRLPGRPRLRAGTRLLQKTKRLEDTLRRVEELRKRAGAAVNTNVLTARGGVKRAL